MQVGGIDLYQQTKDKRQGREGRQRSAPEPAGTRHKRCQGGGGGGGKKGRKGSSRAVTGQVCAQSQLTSSTRPRKERVKARGAIRYDALDTSQPERKAHSASPHHSATHTTTWLPTCLADT